MNVYLSVPDRFPRLRDADVSWIVYVPIAKHYALPSAC